MQTLPERWHKLLADLKPMTPRQRLDHLWTYYKWVPILLLIFIFSLSSLIPGIIESRKEVLFGGLYINLPENDRVVQCLEQDLFSHFGGTDPNKQRVTFNRMTISTATEDVAALYNEHMAIAAQIGAKELDYILMDTSAIEFFSGLDVSENLVNLLTAQQLQALEGKLMYRTDEEGNRFPFAIDLTGTAFADACQALDGKVYIVFPGNTDRAGRTDEFLDYLLNWH